MSPWVIATAGSRLERARLLETVGAAGRKETVAEREARLGGATEVPASSRTCAAL